MTKKIKKPDSLLKKLLDTILEMQHRECPECADCASVLYGKGCTLQKLKDLASEERTC